MCITGSGGTCMHEAVVGSSSAGQRSKAASHLHDALQHVLKQVLAGAIQLQGIELPGKIKVHRRSVVVRHGEAPPTPRADSAGSAQAHSSMAKGKGGKHSHAGHAHMHYQRGGTQLRPASWPYGGAVRRGRLRVARGAIPVAVGPIGPAKHPEKQYTPQAGHGQAPSVGAEPGSPFAEACAANMQYKKKVRERWTEVSGWPEVLCHTGVCVRTDRFPCGPCATPTATFWQVYWPRA